MSQRPAPEPIAIVGIGCRFPGAPDAGAFWRLIREGVDAIGDIPAERFDAQALYDPIPGARGRIATRQGGFLADVDRFDASFFGVSPREATCMDPQQRLLLEVAWEAFEDAGLKQQEMAGTTTGVFVGLWTSEYEGRMFAASSDIDLYVTTGGGRYAASGRLSYAFDLRGPSLTVDTACSSSLVAVHLACQSLRSGESEMALAGGVNLILEPHITIGYSRSAMLSADGRSRFGDARASGYVRSEGVGLVLLKPLSQALSDGDRIYALIRGSAVNNDGQGSGLLVSPSPAAQAAMLRQAYRVAGVDPERVGYVEAHGTGTRVGDPVELTALGEVLGHDRAPGQPCRVGSVKTNIGHAEAASGIAGLIKAAFCLEHRLIPPSLHCTQPNPRIPWDQLRLVVVRALEPWPDEFLPAYAGVNSFGVTGTNAHVVLEAPPAASTPTTGGDEVRSIRVLPVSAKTSRALARLADRWAERLQGDDAAARLDDLCYTASVRRTHHAHRVAVVGASASQFAERLRAHVNGEARPGLVAGQTKPVPPRVAFLFPGQGSQWLGMGRSLLATEPVFRDALDQCDRALTPYVTWSLLAELTADGDRSRLDRIDVIQPVLFALQVAQAALWRSWGVEPEAVIGHSMGEVAAAHVAGSLSLRDAVRIIATRSRLLRRIAGRGAMAMVELSFDATRSALAGREDKLSIAVSNSPRSTVISGDVAALDALVTELEGRGIFCRRIKVDVASHSPQVDELRADLTSALVDVAPRRASVKLYSTVTGAVDDGTALGPEYWACNLRQPVRFATAIRRLAADGFDAFIEMSSHSILLAAVQDSLQDVGREAELRLPSGRRDEDERVVMLESLATLWTQGYPLDWTRLSSGPRRVVSLPSYPWQRERFWHEDGKRARREPGEGQHQLLGTHVALASEPGVHVWTGPIEADAYPCLGAGGDGTVTEFSPAACLEALRGVAGRMGRESLALDNVRFPEVLEVERGGTALQIEIRPDGSGGLRFQALGQGNNTSVWKTLAEGAFVSSPGLDGAAPVPRKKDVAAIQSRTGEVPLELLESWRRNGHATAATRLWLGPRESLACLEAAPNGTQCALHPSTLEAAFRVLATALAGDPERAGDWRLLGLRRLRIANGSAAATWAHATAGCRGSEAATGDLRLFDDTGRMLLELEGVQFAPAPPAPPESLIHRIEWVRRSRDEQLVSDAPGRWILVGSSQDRVAPLATRLEIQGHDVVTVDAFASDDSLARGLSRAMTSGPACRGVVHLASLEVDPGASPLSARAAAGSWSSALAAVQSLAQRADTAAAPRLWIVTCGTQLATPTDAAGSLAGSTLWGLGAVVEHEYPALQCTRVDLPLAWSAADLTRLADEILAGDAEDQIALRGAERHVARLVNGVEGSTDARVPIREDGAYLISGGVGGLGLIVARWLVSRGARHLGLFGRREPSDQALRAIGELRAAGVEVVVSRGDVARAGDVRRILDELPSASPLRGIVHAAGVFDAGLMVNLDPASFAATMRAKVEGALNLHTATLDRPLDFFALFSSAAAVLGFPGVASYAAANAALDALVARRRAEGRPGLSIAWGRWVNVGMHATRGEGNHRLAVDGLGNLATDEGTLALERALTGNSAHLLVTRLDARRWKRAHPGTARSLLRDRCPTPVAKESVEESTDGIGARLRAIPATGRHEALEIWLREQVGQVLRLATASVSTSEPLKTMGLNSLLSIELRHRIEQAFGIVLSITAIWNYPTITVLARYLEGRLARKSPVDITAAPPETDDLEQLLDEIERLSEDEVQRIVAEDPA